MKAKFRIKDDWTLAAIRTFHPFELVREEWKKKVGCKTEDGDLILEVADISDNEIEITIDVISEKTKQMLGGDNISVSFK